MTLPALHSTQHSSITLTDGSSPGGWLDGWVAFPTSDALTSSGARRMPLLGLSASESPLVMKLIASISMAMVATWALASFLRENLGSVL